ncbi:acyl-CoA dehydrogenase family protein [Cupriavidus sp. BIS7]|uniref:acyl-CoA dehydrogenase family protein n=1 Tax=Cupriavidus sp. BIS7 TaxID=1217718 RepID=UPI0003158687|nr:acyl-CoA dehydrogenase family protein [Cupriavidus sp. BIS7]
MTLAAVTDIRSTHASDDATIRADLLRRAAAMVPALRARAPEVDAMARLPESTIAELDDAGVLDMMVPRDAGGLQVSLRTYMEVVSEIGRGDGSAAWACALINVCNWMAAACLPDAARDEVFASGGKVRTAGVLSPRKAVVKRVAGGYLVEEGMWGFNSGVYHAQWDLLGIPLVDEAGNVVDQGMALIPTSDVEFLNDWDTIALRGSGSTTVTVKNKFVPDSRITRLSAILAGDYVSRFGNDQALYRMAFMPVAAIILTFPALGIARAAQEMFLEKLPGRGIQYTWYEKQSEAAVTHLQVGEASAMIDAARLVVERCVDEIDSHARAGTIPDALTRARIRRDTGYASKTMWDAVDILASASGGSLAGARNPFNRVWRDARVANLHGIVCTTTNLELYGRMLCGQVPNTPLV